MNVGDVMGMIGKRRIEGERNCTLIQGMLEYSGGNVVFERTMLRGCQRVFYGPARGTLHYLQMWDFCL